MLPKYHIIYGFFFSLVVLLLFPNIGFFGFVTVFLSSFLLDVDHYTVYVLRKKDFSLRKAYNFWFGLRKKFKNKKNIKSPLNIFHTFEFLIPLFVLSFYSVIIAYIASGWFFHNILDIIELYRDGELNRRQYSLILNLLRINPKYTYM